MDKATILDEHSQVNVNDVNWCFISDYYDGPIEGLLYYSDKVWKFCCFREDVPEQSVYVILRLSKDELENEIKSKQQFEKMVGTHWSYDVNGEKLPGFEASLKTQKEYYENKKESNEFTPYSHEIEAWFTVDVSNA